MNTTRPARERARAWGRHLRRLVSRAAGHRAGLCGAGGWEDPHELVCWDPGELLTKAKRQCVWPRGWPTAVGAGWEWPEDSGSQSARPVAGIGTIQQPHPSASPRPQSWSQLSAARGWGQGRRRPDGQCPRGPLTLGRQPCPVLLSLSSCRTKQPGGNWFRHSRQVQLTLPPAAGFGSHSLETPTEATTPHACTLFKFQE